jgi:hypothetical protein
MSNHFTEKRGKGSFSGGKYPSRVIFVPADHQARAKEIQSKASLDKPGQHTD